MRSLPLYTAENDTAPILEGESWSLATTQPLMGLVGKKQILKQIGTIGDGCNMCHRHKKRDGDSIVKPRFLRGKDPTAPRLLCVFSYNDYGITVDRVVEYLRTFHKGHILLDLPVRCGANTVTDVQLDACRPYLRRSYTEFNPHRIIAFGGRASSAILGVAVPAWQNRWCWTTLPGPTTDAPRVPVVITMDPTNIAKSRVHAKIIQEEIRWAVEAEFDDTRPTGRVFIPEDESDIPAIDQWVAAAKRKTGWVAHDVETDGVMYNPGFSIIAAGFACSEISHALVWDAKALANPALLKKCIEILTDPELGKRGSNIKYDANSWRAWKGVGITPITGDCRLEMKQSNAESSAKLEAMGFYVGINAHKREAKEYMKEAKKLAAEDMDDDLEGVSVYAHVYKYLPPDVMIRYNGLDNYTTAKVCEYSRHSLGPLVSTLDRLILPASEMYADVEAEGMAVDKGNIEVSKSFLEATVVSLTPKFEKEGIDPDKPESIRQWLEKMDIESPILTPTGLASTNAKALGMIHKAIQHKNTIIADILQYRKVAKLLSSYAETLPGYIRGDGRVHPSFLLDGARSGRVSCFAGDQRLWTNHGWVRFDELGSLIAVTSVYTLSHKGVWRRVSACWSNGVRPTVWVKTANGKNLRCTADHRLRSGENWVQARHLGGGTVQTAECAEMVTRKGAEGAVCPLASNVARRLPGRVEAEPCHNTASSVAVALLQSQDEVARRPCKLGRTKKAVFRQHKILVSRLRGSSGSAPREGHFIEVGRQHERQSEADRPTKRRREGNGDIWPERMAASQANRSERVYHTNKPAEAWLGRRDGGSLHEDPGAEPCRFSPARESISRVLRSSEKGERKPVGVSAGRVQYVAGNVLPDAQVQETASCYGGGVQGGTAKAVRTRVLRRRKLLSKRAAKARSSARTPGTLQTWGYEEGCRLYCSGQGCRRGRRPDAPLYSGEGRATDGPVRSNGVRGEALQERLRTQARIPHRGRAGGVDRRVTESRVTSVSDAGETEVFDFTVEVDHSGCVEGIFAHNCQAPALQTIPSRGELAKLIKNCFVSKPGYSLVAADFSILEVRVAAILSQDPDMALAAQTDFHTETAKSLAQVAWGMTPEQVEAEILSGNKSKRDASKTLGFAIIYGAGPDSVAEKIGCSVRMAAQLTEFFLQRYKRLRAWAREMKTFAREHAMVEIPWLDGSLGRIRPLLDIVSADGEKRGNAERAAVNTPIQGLASDICMSSAVRIRKHYREKNIPASIICLVHDSIISEVRDDFIDEAVKLKNHYMTDWPTGPVPLKVEIEVGRAWGSMKKVA